MLSSSSSCGWSGSDSLSEDAPSAGRMRDCACVYWTKNDAVEMFCWDMCVEERDLVVSGKGVYGGGGPRVAVVVVVVTAAVVEVPAELRGRTMGGEEGVKRKGGLGKAAAVAEEARRRVWALCPDEDARLRTVGEVFLRREMVVELRSGPLTVLGWGSEKDIDLARVLLGYDMVVFG